MQIPDGPEQREADAQERAWDDAADFDRLEDRADGDLMDIAQAKMMNWALDRVFDTLVIP